MLSADPFNIQPYNYVYYDDNEINVSLRRHYVYIGVKEHIGNKNRKPPL